MESILNTIKKMLGITEEYKIYDTDIIVHINSVLFTLKQLGVGPKNGFSISSSFETWETFLDDMSQYEAVKSYMYIKVKLLFDANSLSAKTIDAFERQAQEYEVRLRDEADSSASKVEEGIQNGRK